MWAIGLIIGAILGASIGHGAAALLGAALGFVLGMLAGQWKKKTAARLAQLEARIDALTKAAGATDSQQTTPIPAPEAAVFVAARPSVEAEPMADGRVVEQPLPAAAAARPSPAVDVGTPQPVRKGVASAPMRAIPVAAEHSAPPQARQPSAAPPAWLAWITGGNTLARVGVLLLFIGVGFLVKYAAEHVRVPIEFRLSGVALGAVALLILGWRLRLRRPEYAMILQGGGVGILYLTVFAAFRLYALISPTAAFLLLLWIAGLSAWLAIRQDAIALAAVGVVGGFLAPILTSSQTGNHVLLFSYYALLNAGIFGIAWFKAWRSLNLLGFVFTFLMGTFWGVTQYRPEHFATTEPFLVLFFLFYVGVAVLYALRRSVELRRYVDSALVFGTPLVAAGLQSALVRNMPYGMAFSALAASALYLALAWVLYARRTEAIRLLIEAFLALGVIFATLAIPLALDAQWTSATWALEGAAMLWVGVRQRHLVVRIFGLLLQLGAGVAFVLGLSLWGGAAPEKPLPILNSDYIGAVLVGLAGLYSAWLLQRRRADLKQGEQVAAALLLAWGTLWWLTAGWREIEHWLPHDVHVSALVGLVAVTGAAFALAARALAWSAARVPALLLLPALLVIALGSIVDPRRVDMHLFAHGGVLAWPLALAVVIALLRDGERSGAVRAGDITVPLDWWHAGTLWLVTLLAAHELAWAGSHVGSGDGVWTTAPWGLVPALMLAAVNGLASRSAWPIGVHRHAYVIVGAIPLAAWLALWSVGANVSGDGDPLPLPYVPLFNPLDITEAVALLAATTWYLRVPHDENPRGNALNRGVIATILAALLFVWINAIVLRTIHFWFDVPYTLEALWRSRLVQAALALLWSVLALATMVLANRRRWRTAWLTGAALLGLVVAKLFLVDLSQVGGVERIVSFIGVGLLLLLIGYLAPVPPRRPEDVS